MKGPYKIMIICGVALLVAFFMPWEGVVGQVTGWKIATTKGVNGWFQAAIWMVPLGGISLIASGITRAKLARFAALACGAYSIGFFTVQFFRVTTWGLWIVLFAGLIGMIAAAAARQPE